MQEDTPVGKFIKGKEVTEVHQNGAIMNFLFADGNYETAPIIDGKVVIKFDAPELVEGVEESEEIEEDDKIEEVKTGFYKTLEPIPYTDQDGTEVGNTEVGSIQEVPVELGDTWVEQGLAEKVDAPENVLEKVGEAIKNVLGIK